jgi:hypothetical protein
LTGPPKSAIRDFGIVRREPTMSDADSLELDVARQRSPAYPYIPLDLAMERVKKLYDQVRDHPQPREVLAKVYGKPPTSSATIQTFATLIQYGLLENVVQNGQRRLRVTALARTITHPNAPAEAVANGRKTAALNPLIFRELWDRYGAMTDLADDVPLFYLTHDRREQGAAFTERAAHEVLRVYRATLAYAGLTDSDKLLPEEEEEEEGTEGVTHESSGRGPMPQPDRPRSHLPSSQASGRLALAEHERELQTGLLSKSASYRVIVSGRVGVKEIERLIRKLEMDKEILADEEDPRDPDDLRDAALMREAESG